MNNQGERFHTLITGAGAGIGRALAVESARRGRDLFLVSLPGEGLPEFAASLEETHGVEAKALEIDLTGTGAPAEVYRRSREWGLRIDRLINNAGRGYTGPFEKFDHDFYERLIALNATALALLTRLFLPELKKRPRASILNVGSMGSFVPVPYKAVYAATKSFVYSFSLALKRELKGTPVKVALLCPGAVPTNQDVLDRIASDRPLTRVALTRAEDVARIAMRNLERGKTVTVPGLGNKLTLIFLLSLPRRLRPLVTAWFYRGYSGKE